ncbi:MAG: YjcZ family sporulation protein [Anaerobacillus sp.]|jgi:uncharacterized protein (TIGR01732 family)|uniref:YjcZ family sporulation protein n=1 Tax=Anaerobacillus sp. TaxID=1872506 RepID=UPI00391A1906
MYGHGCWDPCGLGYGAPVHAAPVARPAGTGFALIVVLFILLVIVGAAWYPRA